jgi:L-asparaginase
MRRISALVCLFLSGVVLAQDTGESTSQVLILTTGGTIASRTDAPLIDGPALVQAVPQLLDYASIKVEEFSVIGSSKMTPARWLALVKRINEIYSSDGDLAGIVITHGTDTMEETAYFLNLTVQWDRPVVLVGSMRSSTEVSADGPANLINAVRVAISDQAVGQGVLVVLNEDISAARDVWKTDNRRVQTFDGSNVGHIGAVDPDGVRFYHRSLQPHTTTAEFDVSNIDVLPDVLILSDFTGIDRKVVERFGGQPMDGLVVRTFAGGRMSEGASTKGPYRLATPLRFSRDCLERSAGQQSKDLTNAGTDRNLRTGRDSANLRYVLGIRLRPLLAVLDRWHRWFSSRLSGCSPE